MASPEAWLLENGNNIKVLSKEMRNGRTAHNVSSSSLRKKSDLSPLSGIRVGFLRDFLGNLQVVLLGTKLSVFFLAIPFAVAAKYRRYGSSWVFALSCVALIPLAERVSFLTEQIALFTGPTVGGLLNATCGNATELIIAIFALIHNKVDVVKYSLLGSILSNLLLVLGSSLLCGGIANISKEQKFERKQADVNSVLLLLGLVCHILALMLKLVGTSGPELTAVATLALSRGSSIIMLIAYIAYLAFQLFTHRQFFQAPEPEEEETDDDNVESEETKVIGWCSAFIWLLLFTAVVAVLSEYVVDTIEAASTSWSLSVGFTSVILLPIVGNAVEHAGAVIFAFRNKLDITLGVALGSATQISMFVVPLSVIISWIIGVKMDLEFSVVGTVALSLSILLTAFTLQDGSSHYLKGLVLVLCYIVLGACFFVYRAPLGPTNFGLDFEYGET